MYRIVVSLSIDSEAKYPYLPPAIMNVLAPQNKPNSGPRPNPKYWWPFPRLVPVSGRIILGTDDQTTSLLGTSIHRFKNVNELLLILKNPFDLVVVTGSQIDHHVLVSEEEHEGARVIQLVHLVEVGNLVDVAEVNHGEVAHLVGDLVQHFVLAHTIGIPIAAEANDDEAIFL